jgi:alkylhydroperoxidase/carboxymuconolactone decarboxylase family protein YurZ
MTERRGAASRARAAAPAQQWKGQVSTPYGYAWTDWLAREDPKWATARLSVSAMAFAEGQELSVKHREMVAIGILCFRGRQDGVVAHMRRAIQHGATKRELLEAIQSASIPGGGPTLSAGVQALMQLEKDGAFERGAGSI